MEVKKLNRIKVVMAEKDLFNIWLSEKLGVSQATVSKWMTNFSRPNLETLIKISKILNVEVSELIRTDEVQIVANAGFSIDESKLMTVSVDGVIVVRNISEAKNNDERNIPDYKLEIAS